MLKTTRVPATKYEYSDTPLEDAAIDFAKEHDLDRGSVTAAYEGGEDGRRDVIVITHPECHCQCGTVIGERCAWSGPRADTLEIQWVPPYLRGTARAAGSVAGVTERLRLHHECAALILETVPEWTWRD